jgi:GT2 family glycosyltransferase
VIAPGRPPTDSIEPLISVVIVTWNRRDDVLTTVRALRAQAYENYQIVVVDNGSTDGTVQALQRDEPGVDVIPLPDNVGAAAGRNPGIDAAKGPIVFFLDSDADPAPDTLSTIAAKLTARPDVAGIACKVLNAETRAFDKTAGWIFSEKDKVDADREFSSFSFPGCGSAFRTDVLREVGGFWSALFFGREEEELSLRILDKGHEILYCPTAVVYHRVSPHVRVAGGRREYFDCRNALYTYLARYPWWMVGLFAPIRVAVATLRGLRRGHLGQVLRAVVDVARNLPSVLAQRHPISNRTARRYLKLQREHGPLRWDLVTWFRHKL